MSVPYSFENTKTRQDPEITCSDYQLDLIQFASKTIKKAGFYLHYTSMKSEACYYRLGDRIGSLRIAGHRFSNRREGRILAFPVWSCLTFLKEYKTADAVLSDIEHAVGRYIMYPHTKLCYMPGKDNSVKRLFLSENKESDI